MPSFARKVLRQEVGVVRLRECTLGTAQLAVPAGTFVNVFDPNQANLDFSGQSLFQRAWLRVASMDYRVGSFNFQSGAFVSAQLVQQAIASGADFEVHERLSAHELDLAIDEVIKGIRVEREVAFNTIDGLQYYGIETVASPHTVIDIGNIYFFSNPNGSTDRGRSDLSQYTPVMTATGREIRLPVGLGGSQQIVLDALVELTLPADDASTITLLNSDWVSWGAAAHAYNIICQRTPGQDSALMEKRRGEAARQFTKLSGRRQATLNRRIVFDAPLSGEGYPEGALDPSIIPGIPGGF